MIEKYMKGFYYSGQIALVYEELKDLDDITKFNDYIDRIKSYRTLEDEAYNELSLEDVNQYLDRIKDTDLEDDTIYRYKLKLIERKNILTNKDTLSTLIDAIIMLNTLKLMNRKIEKLLTDNIFEPGLIMILKLYFDEVKYTFLASSSYLENIAIKYEYDLRRIPDINLLEIYPPYLQEEYLTIQTVLTEKAIEYIKKEKEENTDSIENIFMGLMQEANFEIIINYLDKKRLGYVIKKYNEEKKKNRNIRNILVKKREKIINKGE